MYRPIACVPALVILAQVAQAADISGIPRVIDGDTIEISKQKIRLFGIDAPEGKQSCTIKGKPWRCGDEAAAALKFELAGREVACRQRDVDRYKRVVAVCYVGDVDINERMVRNGWALAYRQFSRDYVHAEDAARKERAGIWRGEFQKPWEWRTR